ncbi:MAG: hypothetical protein QM760_08960 [Nibricoccus sp.]
MPLPESRMKFAFGCLITATVVGLSRADERTALRSVRIEALRLITEDINKGTPLIFGQAEAPIEIPEDVVLLDPLETTDKKIPDFFPAHPPETKFEEFVRTGTIWEKGRIRFWAKGDQGLMLDLRF